MLQKLVIKNVALIENAEIVFGNGLNVLSGETGSGKSVVIDALNFVLGAKADKTMIKSGCAFCFAQAEFDASACPSVSRSFDDFGFEPDDLLIISRRFYENGKNEIKVNGNTVTVSMLRKFTQNLVDVHGQSEHFFLLKESNQLRLVDFFGGEKAEQIKGEIAVLAEERKNILSGIRSLGGNAEERAGRIDLLKYQTEEISRAQLTPGEDEELTRTKQKLNNQEKILFALNGARDALICDNGASDAVSAAAFLLNSVVGLDGEYAELYERLMNCKAELDDVASESERLTDAFEFDEGALERTEERLEEIKKLKKKYGGSIEEVIAFAENAKTETERLLGFEEQYGKYMSELKKTEKNLYAFYVSLSASRRETAQTLSGKIKGELKELGMKNASFEIAFSEPPAPEECEYSSADGFDSVEIEFSANLGEPVKPLSKIISGGEISRVMLAVKAQTAGATETSTFVFDEIDAGISGETAKTVAEKFARISLNAQIIAITHLPQIAAMSDCSFLLEKIETDGSTHTEITPLNAEGKIKEVTRLAGGNTESEAATRHAAELVKNAESYKKALADSSVCG